MRNQNHIRPVRTDDLPTILELIRELADFEKALHEVVLDVGGLEDAVFGDKPILEIIVSELNGKITGAAMFFEKFSTWAGRGLHLEDLIVSESLRGKGIGALLFEAVMQVAYERGYARMDWQVLDWNAPAIKFYEKYEAEISTEWLNGRFTRNDLAKWAKKQTI